MMSTNSAVEAIVSRVNELPVLPQVVYKLIEVTGASRATIEDVEHVVSVDPGLAMKVLVLANGSHFGSDIPTTSIFEATRRLGMTTVRQLAMTVTVFDIFVGKADEASLRRREWWRHGVDTAICAQAIAKVLGTDAGEAYTCGLLHDVGKPLLEKFGDGEYGDVLKSIESGIGALTAEESAFGCHHAEAGARVAEVLRIPAAIVESIKYHHEPKPGPVPEYVAITALANDCAHYLVTGKAADGEWMLTDWAAKKFGIDEEKAKEIFDACRAAMVHDTHKIA